MHRSFASLRMTIVFGSFSVLQFSPPQRSGRSHSGFQFLPQWAGVQQVEEAFHLALESASVAEPPDFFHARNQVAVEILHAHHFFQAPTPVRTTQATRLHAAIKKS